MSRYLVRNFPEGSKIPSDACSIPQKEEGWDQWIALSLPVASELFHMAFPVCYSIILTPYLVDYNSKNKYLNRPKVVAASVSRPASRKWSSITSVLFYVLRVGTEPIRMPGFKLYLLVGGCSKNLWPYITCHCTRGIDCKKWLNSS